MGGEAERETPQRQPLSPERMPPTDRGVRRRGGPPPQGILVSPEAGCSRWRCRKGRALGCPPCRSGPGEPACGAAGHLLWRPQGGSIGPCGSRPFRGPGRQSNSWAPLAFEERWASTPRTPRQRKQSPPLLKGPGELTVGRALGGHLVLPLPPHVTFQAKGSLHHSWGSCGEAARGRPWPGRRLSRGPGTEF